VIAAIFPGQGSQKPGMGQELADQFAEASIVFDEISSATGIDLRHLCWHSDEDTLRRTENAQLALFTCGLAAWTVLNVSAPGRIKAVAGHSIGEYSAAVAAGIFKLDDAARLVQTRGDLMARAGEIAPGTMAAVLGLDRDLLQQACEAAAGCVVVANDNSPGQLVLSGERSAVERAGALALEAGAKRVLPLNVSGAFHSPLMATPAKEMGKALSGVTASPPDLRIYSNVTSEPAEDGIEWPVLLERQLLNPVRWTESVQHMVRDGVDTFIECGVGEVLSGLIRRIDKSVKTFRVSDKESLEKTLEAIAQT
jgi:[acyl-carrier-protein] S-malonyltransferase